MGKTVVTKKREIDTVIFDFDGVIADSRRVAIKSYNDVCKLDLTEEEFLKKPLKSFIENVTTNKIMQLFLVRRFKKAFNRYLSEITLNPYSYEVLEDLKSTFRIILVTSNSKENIIGIDGASKIIDLFDITFFDVGFLTKEKKLNPYINGGVYVGDEVRDIISCKKIGMPIISISSGYDCKELLISHNPDSIIEDLSQVRIALDGL